MGLGLRFSLSTGPSNLNQSKVCSGRTPHCHKALTCGDKSASEALSIKESLGKKGSPFPSLGTSHTIASTETDRSSCPSEHGSPRVPSGEQPTASLCNLSPTANLWQAQWALSAEHTVNASTFPCLSTATTLARTSPISCLDFAFISQPLLLLLPNLESTQQPE